MNHYVVTFVRDPDWNAVLMVRKNRPDWQAGKLNGVGGKVEPGEYPRNAAKRELKEETGLEINIQQFRHFCTLRGRENDWLVDFFRVEGGGLLVLNPSRDSWPVYRDARKSKTYRVGHDNGLNLNPDLIQKTDEALELINLDHGVHPEDAIDNIPFLLGIAFSPREYHATIVDHGIKF